MAIMPIQAMGITIAIQISLYLPEPNMLLTYVCVFSTLPHYHRRGCVVSDKLPLLVIVPY